MDPFVNTVETYDRTITDSRDGETWTATYRPLTAGDRAVLQDLTRMSVSDTDSGSAEMRLGAAQILTLDRAIVSWTLPHPKTRATIEALNPDIFDELFNHISWGVIPAELEAERTADPLPSSNGQPDAGEESPTESTSSSDRPLTSVEDS